MNELITQLVQKLGVDESQAKGGAGLLLKLAQSKLGSDFCKVTEAVPGTTDLVKSAPESGGAASLLGGLAGALGGGKASGIADLASLTKGFSQLKLDPAMIAKFVPVILSFVQNKGGDTVMQLLSKGFKGVGA